MHILTNQDENPQQYGKISQSSFNIHNNTQSLLVSQREITASKKVGRFVQNRTQPLWYMTGRKSEIKSRNIDF